MKTLLKVVIITAIVIAAGSAAYFGWQYLFNGQENNSVTTEVLVDITTRPEKLSDSRIFDYWVNKNTDEINYIAENGDIYRIDSSGNPRATGAKTLGELSFVKPSFDGSKLLVAFGYPQNPTFALHDLELKTWQAMPEGTLSADWDPQSSDRIAYLKNNGGSDKIYLLNLTNNKASELLKLNQNDLELEWVLVGTIYLKERPSSQISNSVWAYNFNSDDIKTLAKESRGLMFNWGEGGDIGIRLSEDDVNVVDASNRILSGVGFKTLPSKCAFSETEIYCAAPADQVAASSNTYLDNYLKRRVNSIDDIYLVSLSDLGRVANLLTIKIYNSLFSEDLIDADHLEIYRNNLLFINRFDKKLYSLEI